MTDWWSDHAANLSTAPRLYLNSLSELSQNWRQINPNLNDNHCDPVEISSTLWILDITEWWHQQEEMHSKYADLSNVACDISSSIRHGVGVKANCSLGQDVIGWRQSKTTHKTHHEKVIVRQFSWSNTAILAGNETPLDTTNTENDLEMKSEAEEKKLHRMAKVHDFLEMWQGSQNLCATQKEFHCQNKQMTAVGYISDAREMVNPSWSNFQPVSAAAFKLSERSPLPPAVSKHPPWRTNSCTKCLRNQNNRPPFSPKWWGLCTWKHFRHQKLAWLGWWLGWSKWQRRRLGGRYWFWNRARQWHWGSWKPRAAGC